MFNKLRSAFRDSQTLIHTGKRGLDKSNHMGAIVDPNAQRSKRDLALSQVKKKTNLPKATILGILNGLSDLEQSVNAGSAKNPAVFKYSTNDLKTLRDHLVKVQAHDLADALKRALTDRLNADQTAFRRGPASEDPTPAIDSLVDSPAEPKYPHLAGAARELSGVARDAARKTKAVAVSVPARHSIRATDKLGRNFGNVTIGALGDVGDGVVRSVEAFGVAAKAVGRAAEKAGHSSRLGLQDLLKVGSHSRVRELDRKNRVNDLVVSITNEVAHEFDVPLSAQEVLQTLRGYIPASVNAHGEVNAIKYLARSAKDAAKYPLFYNNGQPIAASFDTVITGIAQQLGRAKQEMQAGVIEAFQERAAEARRMDGETQEAGLAPRFANKLKNLSRAARARSASVDSSSSERSSIAGGVRNLASRLANRPTSAVSAVSVVDAPLSAEARSKAIGQLATALLVETTDGSGYNSSRIGQIEGAFRKQGNIVDINNALKAFKNGGGLQSLDNELSVESQAALFKKVAANVLSPANYLFGDEAGEFKADYDSYVDGQAMHARYLQASVDQQRVMGVAFLLLGADQEVTKMGGAQLAIAAPDLFPMDADLLAEREAINAAKSAPTRTPQEREETADREAVLQATQGARLHRWALAMDAMFENNPEVPIPA